MSLTLTELKTEISIIVKDESDYVTDNLENFINEALYAVTDETDIPDLKSLTSVSTELAQAWVNMPSGFNGKLLYAGDANGGITIYPGGLEDLLLRDPGLDRVGSVDSVALEGSVLYYQGIPETSATITLLLYERPTLLSSANPTAPDYIPLHLQRGLLSHRAAAVIFDKIEDAFEGRKANMEAQMLLAESYMTQFREHLGRRRRSHMKSCWRT